MALSGVRLLPMVVALMPMLRGPKTRAAPADAAGAFHRGQHVGGIHAAGAERCRSSGAFRSCNGLATGYLMSAVIATVLGYYLAARLPVLLTAALLLPDADVVPGFDRAAIPAKLLVDRLALVLGLVRARYSRIATSNST